MRKAARARGVAPTDSRRAGSNEVSAYPVTVIRCVNCGASLDDDTRRSCYALEAGEGNSANPSGVLPVPADHKWAKVEPEVPMTWEDE